MNLTRPVNENCFTQELSAARTGDVICFAVKQQQQDDAAVSGSIHIWRLERYMVDMPLLYCARDIYLLNFTFGDVK